MKKMWRCYNASCSEDAAGRLGYDFFADHPTCPKCKSTLAKPEHQHLITPIVITHFVFLDPKGKIRGARGLMSQACNRSLTKFMVPPLGQTTSEFAVVSCPECKESKEWLAAITESSVAMDFDLRMDFYKKTYVEERSASASESQSAPAAESQPVSEKVGDNASSSASRSTSKPSSKSASQSP